MTKMSGIMPVALCLSKVVLFLLQCQRLLWIRDGNTSHSIQGRKSSVLSMEKLQFSKPQYLNIVYLQV